MPYCSKCGNQVTDADQFCAKCGARQAGATRPASSPASMNPRLASVLCYIPVVGGIVSIVVLASDTYRHSRTVRFHAFQGLYLFVAWLIVRWVVGWFFPFHFERLVVQPLQLVLLACWIFMIVKTSQERMYSLPVIGELAENSLSE